MTEFKARIGRVRMKNGGADVRLIEGFAPRSREEEETPEATLLRSAREISAEGPVACFAIVSFSSEGKVAFNWRFTDESPIARTLLPSYISELVRRYMITREEASVRFNEMFEWREK